MPAATEEQVRNNLIIDKHIFGIAEKIGLGYHNISNHGIFHISKNISRDDVPRLFNNIYAYIKRKLKNRSAKDLTEKEWKKIYESYKKEENNE